MMTLYTIQKTMHHSAMWRFLLVLSLFMVASISSLTSAYALDVNAVRIAKHADKTRIVMDLDDSANFTAFVLKQPSRLVVDLPSFDWRAPVQVKQSGAALISSIRHGTLSGDTSRVVFDLHSDVELIKSFKLPAQKGKSPRIVLDVRKIAGVSNPIDQVQVSNDKPIVAKTIESKPTAIVPEQGFKQPVRAKQMIVIDPGHGGKDPGAVSGKIWEKNIALSLSREIKKELDAMGRYKVHLTRSDDRYIKLHNRVKIARNKNADLFVSVHADSLLRKTVRGASVYTLSEKASDAQTARLAAKENKVDLIHGIDLTHEDKEVAGILLDLVQRDTMNQSNFFAEKLVASLKNEGIRTLDNPHRSAGFAVLKAPDIPSVLIEAGFISNSRDAKLLIRPAYQRRLARTIARGIHAYLQQGQQN